MHFGLKVVLEMYYVQRIVVNHEVRLVYLRTLEYKVDVIASLLTNYCTLR